MSAVTNGQTTGRSRDAGNDGKEDNSAPLTYSARTDICFQDTDVQPNGHSCSGKGLSFRGRNTCGDGCNGSAWLDLAPDVGGLYGQNTVIIDPDFGTRIVRVTDYSMHASGGSFTTASGGNQSLRAVDSTLFLVRNSSGSQLLFSLDTHGSLTTTLTAIHNSNVGGDCPGPATSDPCSGATHLVKGADVNFSSSDPDVMYEMDRNRYNGVAVNQINKLTIVKNNPSDPSTWTMTRVKLFNFNCEGASCPKISETESFLNGVNVGTSSHNCLPANFDSNWTDVANPSNDDQSFTLAVSDAGQGGKPAPGKAGAIYAVIFAMGKGCRVYNTFAGVIHGDWGDVGSIVGADGLTPLLDKFNLHGAGDIPDSKYSGISPGNTTCADVADPAHCAYSCMFGKTPSFCENYFWENATRIVRPCSVQCSGHGARGFINIYKGKQYRAHSFGAPASPLTPLLTDKIGFPGDNHGSYANAGTQDLTPMLLSVTQVCGQAPGMQGSGPCVPMHTGPRYNELVAIENAVGNAGNSANSYGRHCDYGAGPTPCVYRLAHTFNTGTNWLFNAQNAMATISPDGHYAVFESDWNDTLGCTDGTASNCMDSITASGGGMFQGANYASCPAADLSNTPCQRADVFVIDLTSAHGRNRSTGIR
jgi:hypothetical protein